MPQKYN
ncbi:hypothetical protein VTL71DRAFT_3847 [Oculimacula yallundae]